MPGHKPLILFVPGFKGSYLRRSPAGRRIWITLQEALLGSCSLGLPVPGTDTGCVELQPDGVIEQLRMAKGLWQQDHYGSWLDRLRQHFGSSVDLVPFGYDWRQGVQGSCAQLEQVVDRHDPTSTRPLAVLGHSYGGLIASVLMVRLAGSAKTRRKQAVLVTAGTPFLGVPSMFRSLDLGMVTGRNRRLLAARVLASFPASYQLLPPSDHPYLYLRDGTLFADPLGDAATWLEHQWGLFNTSGSRDSHALLAHLQHMLDSASGVYALLQTPQHAVQAPPVVLNIYGRGQPTPARVYLGENGAGQLRQIKSRDALKDPEIALPQLLYAPGDGTVPAESAQLPVALQAWGQGMETTAVHAALLQQEHIQGEVLALLDRTLFAAG